MMYPICMGIVKPLPVVVRNAVSPKPNPEAAEQLSGGIQRGRETEASGHRLFPESAIRGRNRNRRRPGQLRPEGAGSRKMVGKVLNTGAISGSDVGNSEGTEKKSDFIEYTQLFASVACTDKDGHEEFIILAQNRRVREVFRDADG